MCFWFSRCLNCLYLRLLMILPTIVFEWSVALMTPTQAQPFSEIELTYTSAPHSTPGDGKTYAGVRSESIESEPKRIRR